MEIRNLKYLTVAIALAAFVFTGTACGNTGGEQASNEDEHMENDHQHADDEGDHSHEHSSSHEHNEQSAQEDDESMSWKIEEEEGPVIVEEYLALKDALVNTDREAAATGAEKFLDNTENMDGSQAMEKFRDLMKKVANAKDVTAQRKTFEELSEQLYRIARVNELDQTLYRQYCPMAFDNEGANWFSTDEKILNPYFGDKMLSCGAVKETIEGK